MKLGSLFDGIGGFPLASLRNEIEPVWASEIESFPIEVTERHFPNMKHLGDITKIKGSEIEPVDIITAGSPCFPAGTLVISANGYVPIENVNVGDMVLTHTGKWQRVLRVGNRVADTIILKGFGHPGLETTREHPFYATFKKKRWRNNPRGYDSYITEPEWVEAQHMEGRFWATPLQTDPLAIPSIPKSSSPSASPVPVMDEYFWWFVGYWLGNGWVRNGQRPNRPEGQTWGQVFVCTGHSKADELEQKLRLTSMAWTQLKERTTIKFRTGNHMLANWLAENFGQYANGKTIPTWVFSLPCGYRQAILDGITDSDGWCRPDGVMSITTVSKRLAFGTRMIAESLGYSSKVYFAQVAPTKEIEGRIVRQRPQYNIRYEPMKKGMSRVEAYGYSWGLVKSVREGHKAVQVYNLEVEHDNSYVVENIVVHNCQDLSVAGKRAGLEGEQSGLFMEFVRIVREMREATNGAYPKFIVWENVPGAFSSNRGADFRAVLEEIMEAEIPMPYSGKWATSGMVRGNGRSVAWRVLDAQYWGVPQRRKRIFLVCDFRGHSAPEILFERQSLCGDSEAGGEAWEEAAVTTGRDAQATGFRMLAFGEYADDDSASTCKARDYKDATDLVVQAYALQGSMIGRADKNGPQGSGVNEGISSTLNTVDRHAVAPVHQLYEMSHTDNPLRPVNPPDLAPTLMARMGTGGNNVPVLPQDCKVRRLTPLECERLQGFPDGWTDLGTDSKRYKAIGNSLAVPCAEFILRGIANYRAKDVYECI